MHRTIIIHTTSRAEDSCVSEAITERENHQQSKKGKKNSFNKAKIHRIGEKLIDEDTVSTHYIGKMNQTCQHCGALYFASEETTNNQFSKCCHNGKIDLEAYTDYPQYLQRLMNGNDTRAKDYRNNIREYNNKLAFGNFVATLDILPTVGPSVYRIHGQTY